MLENILSSLREELLTRTPLDALPEPIWKRAGALNTWGTNAIEGNTLTLKDVEQLVLEGRSVANRPMPDVLETLQHDAAFRGLVGRRTQPIRLRTALELHEAVFRGVLSDAGQWRRINVRIEGSRHVPPRMERIEALLAEWEEAYRKRDMLGEPAFPLGAWMHHRFESIHPFSNGNGRVGRLLLNLHFLRHNWPSVHILPPDRDRYLGALESGHAGPLNSLEEFLRIAMGRSLLDLLDQVGTKDDELRPLKKLGSRGTYSAKYLALRAHQGKLPAVKVTGDWRTSPRAIRVYRAIVGHDGSGTSRSR
jgi:Fic family protein